jgi:hypothetical protein
MFLVAVWADVETYEADTAVAEDQEVVVRFRADKRKVSLSGLASVKSDELAIVGSAIGLVGILLRENAVTNQAC